MPRLNHRGPASRLALAAWASLHRKALGPILPLLFHLWGTAGSWEAALPRPVVGGVPLLHAGCSDGRAEVGIVQGPLTRDVLAAPSARSWVQRGAGVPGGWGELHPGAGPLSHGAEQPRELQCMCMVWLGVVVPRALGR